MGLLNIFKSPDQILMLMQKQWTSQLNPVLQNAFIKGSQLSNIALVANTPLTINHYLGRQMQGWLLVDKNANAVIWRTQNFNSQTLTLEASANVTINLWVF